MKFSFVSVLAGAAAVLALSGGALQAQTTVLYNATTLPANPQTGVVNYLESVNLAQGNGTYTLNSFVLGVNYTAGGEDDYGVIVTFYSGVNTSPTAANALATATDIGGVEGTLQDPGQGGNYTYTFTLNTPMSLPTGTLGVEFQLTNSTFDTYSDDLNGRFSAVAPTVGSSPGYVYNDANADGVFAGSEQTKFGQTGAYVRFEMIGSAPVPEPGTWAMTLGGLGLLGGIVRSRRAGRA